MTLDQVNNEAKRRDLIASMHRVGYGPSSCELHDEDGWLIASTDSWERAFSKADENREECEKCSKVTDYAADGNMGGFLCRSCA